MSLLVNFRHFFKGMKNRSKPKINKGINQTIIEGYFSEYKKEISGKTLPIETIKVGTIRCRLFLKIKMKRIGHSK